MDASTRVRTFIISLPRDKDRRQGLERQLHGLGMPFAVLDGVDGRALPEAQLQAAYDRKASVALFNRELSRGEIGCALSHLAVYRKMIDENIAHALVLEDDARILDEELPAILERLAEAHAAHAPVAVLLNHVKRYCGNTGVRLDARRGVYDAYRGVCAHGYFITRAAAQVLAARLYPVHVVADKWEYFQAHFIAVKALVPYAVGLAPVSLASTIDGMGARVRKVAGGGNRLYYLKRNLGNLLFAVASRPFLAIRRQERSELDLC